MCACVSEREKVIEEEEEINVFTIETLRVLRTCTVYLVLGMWFLGKSECGCDS